MTENEAKQLMGQRLREAREAVGLSQSAVAAVLGCSNVTISGYELGRTWIPTKDLVMLARTVGRSASWLLGEPETVSEAQKQAMEQTKRQLSAHLDEVVAAMWRSSLRDPLVDQLVQRLNALGEVERRRYVESFLRLIPEHQGDLTQDRGNIGVSGPSEGGSGIG